VKVKTLADYTEIIHYSQRYSDDTYEYRHVILPKPMLRLLPKTLFASNETGALRILSEAEWRGIGITQSLGWEHYEVHAPEPHVLLFRRLKGLRGLRGPEGIKPAGNGRTK